jgi:hypothetical protein
LIGEKSKGRYVKSVRGRDDDQTIRDIHLIFASIMYAVTLQTIMKAVEFLIASFFASFAVLALEKPYSVELDEPRAENEGPIRRLRSVSKGNLTEWIPGHPEITTIYQLVQSAVTLYDKKDCLGSRSVVTTHVEQKNVTKFINGKETQVPKTWIYKELSPYHYRTYQELGEESLNVGSGLRSLGLRPSHKIAIYGETR